MAAFADRNTPSYRHYDPKRREARGVYYIPEPVVSYIVRSVDHILKKDFQIGAGLASDGKYPLFKEVENPRGGTKLEKTGEARSRSRHTRRPLLCRA